MLDKGIFRPENVQSKSLRFDAAPAGPRPGRCKQGLVWSKLDGDPLRYGLYTGVSLPLFPLMETEAETSTPKEPNESDESFTPQEASKY